MKIECILHRKGGTHIEMPGKKYHFAPQDDGRHVADVDVDTHIERFLAIPEAYRILRAPGAEATAAVAQAGLKPADDNPPATTVEPGQLFVAGATFPPSFEIDGKTYTLDQITLRAFQDSGLTVENWNGLDDEARATKTEIVLDALEAGEITIDEPAPEGNDSDNDEDQPDEAAERAALFKQYEERFGKLPRGNMKTETLRAKLEAGLE